MMTKLFAWSASQSRRLLNSGHLSHFLCCTICTMHLLQIFRPKLPIIEPQLQLFPFLATDCHYHCSNLSYSLSLLHLCNYTCKYHHQMQEWINRQIVFKMKLFDVIGFCTWWKSWWCHWWWWCQMQITLPAASSIIERWGVVVVRPRVRSTPRGPNRCTTNCAMLWNILCAMWPHPCKTNCAMPWNIPHRIWSKPCTTNCAMPQNVQCAMCNMIKPLHN